MKGNIFKGVHGSNHYRLEYINFVETVRILEGSIYVPEMKKIKIVLNAT